MEEFEKNNMDAPEKQVKTEANTTKAAEGANVFEEKAREKQASLPNQKAEATVYNTSIPAPTKYDHAQRSYRDTLLAEQQMTYAPTPERNGPAIAALILGIISMVMVIIPIIGWIIGFGTSVAGIVLGIYGVKNRQKRGMAIAGLVLSILALMLIVVITIIFIVLIISSVINGINSYSYRYYAQPYGSNPFDSFFPSWEYYVR